MVYEPIIPQKEKWYFPRSFHMKIALECVDFPRAGHGQVWHTRRGEPRSSSLLVDHGLRENYNNCQKKVGNYGENIIY